MEKVAVLIVVRGGVAYDFAPEFADVRVVDIDNINTGDYGPEELPDNPAWRTLAAQAGLIGQQDSEVESGYIVFVPEK